MWFRKKKLLIVDDTEIMCTLFFAEFEEDMDVITLSEGSRAQAVAAAEKPDVIICDINMPDVDGLEVLKRLYAAPETRAIPVVIITGASFNIVVERKARGNKNCKGFLNKLSSREDIRKTVFAAMG